MAIDPEATRQRRHRHATIDPSTSQQLQQRKRYSTEGEDATARDHSLLSLVTMIQKIKQRRRNASDQYVIRFLKSLGVDCDTFLGVHNSHFNTPLSVKRDLEPVVLFLMSTGLSKEEVGRVAAKAPLLFRKDPAQLFDFFEELRRELRSDDKARGVLLRKPRAFVVDGLDAFREAAGLAQRDV